MTTDAHKLLLDQDKFIDELMDEIKNLSQKLARKEEEGWEGSRRRGVYQPAERQNLAERLAVILSEKSIK